MKKRILLTGLAASLFFLSACSSSPQDKLADRLEKMEERQLEIQERQNELEQEKREAQIEALPTWVLNPPPADATGVFGVGSAQSKRVSHGMKAARLQAEFELAKMFSQELSGSERSFERGDSEGNVQSQTTFLIDKIVDSVPVVGYTVVEQSVVPIDGVNHFYVLLKLPYDEFNRVLQAQKAEALDNTVQAAFDDLERRLSNRRAEKQAAAQQAFDQEQAKINNRAKRLSSDVPTSPDATQQNSNESPLD